MAGNAIDVIFRADTSSMEAAANKVEALSKRQTDAIQRAADKQVADNNRFIASIQRQVDTFGLSGTAMLAYEAKLRGVTAAADPLIERLNKMKDAQEAFGKSGTGTSFDQIKDGANASSHATAGLTREFIVLGHELSQGNFKRFGGSLLVLAEYSTTAQAAIKSLAGPVGVVVGALGLFALAMYEGDKAATKLRNSLLLTGNFAGQTAGSFEALTKSVAGASGSTMSKAAEALQALVDTGEIGPRELQKMGEATVKLESLTGKSAEEIAKDFGKMADAPTKWAAEANKAYNFLSMPQYDYIKRLEEQGKKEEAEMEVLARLNDHLGHKVPESLSLLGRALQGAGVMWDEFWHAAYHGTGPETVEDKLANIERQLGDASKGTFAGLNGGGLNTGAYGGQKDSTQNSKDYLEGQRNLLLHDQLRQSENALSQATQARYAKAGIAASDYFSKLQEERKGTDRLKKDLDELQANIQKRVDAGGPKSLPEDAENEAFIRHRDRSFQDKAGDRSAQQLENTYRTTMAALGEEKIRLDANTESWKKYGRAIGDSKEAETRFSIDQGKLTGRGGASLTEAQKNAAMLEARDVDNSKRAEDAAKLNTELDNRVKRLAAATNAQAMNSREVEIANDMAAAEKAGLVAGTAAWEAYRAKIVQTVNAEHDRTLAVQMRDSSSRVDEQVKKLQAETDAIGAGTLARMQMVEALRIEDEARKRLLESPGSKAQIEAEAAVEKARMSSALASNYGASRTFESGSKTAFQKYQEDAGNAAAYAEKMMSGSFQHIEDALVNFVHTGKLSFSSLFTFMADEFLRNTIRMEMASVMKGGASGGIGGVIGSLGGAFLAGNTGLATGVANALPGDSLDNLINVTAGFGTIPGHKDGLDYVPYDGYVASLHQGERVQTADEVRALQGKGSGHTFDFSGQTINVGQGVNRGEVAAAVAQGNAQAELRIRRLMKQGALQ